MRKDPTVFLPFAMRSMRSDGLVSHTIPNVGEPPLSGATMDKVKGTPCVTAVAGSSEYTVSSFDHGKCFVTKFYPFSQFCEMHIFL